MALTTLQWAIAFVAGLWWTERWLLHRTVARWRFVGAGLVGGLLWIILAYTASNAQAVSSGVVISIQSRAMLWFGVFMVVLHFVGIILGLTLWGEEEAEQAGTIGKRLLDDNP